MAMRSIRAKNADIRRAWSNVEVLLPETAATLGMSVDCLRDRAQALGLPQRRTGRREVIRPHQEREFRLMWRAGVAARQISAHFDCSYFAIINTAVRLDLQARGAGFRPRMTLSAYCEARLGIAMRASVAAESAHKKGVIRG